MMRASSLPYPMRPSAASPSASASLTLSRTAADAGRPLAGITVLDFGQVYQGPYASEDDHFFSRFTAMIRSSPVLPLIGGGMTRFQPVFVDDMTEGLLALLKCSETAGKTYEFGGPQVYSFKVLLELLLTALNRQRVLIPIPFALAEMQAALFERLPNPPLTRDQVRLLKTDKVVSGAEPTLGDLGVQPRPLDEFLAVFKDKYS
jgi:NADH dehydrogenase